MVCAIVEHGGHGGAVSAPIARVVLEKYFGMQNVVDPGTIAKAGEAAAHQIKAKTRGGAAGAAVKKAHAKSHH